jgi:hypothetical protein
MGATFYTETTENNYLITSHPIAEESNFQII